MGKGHLGCSLNPGGRRSSNGDMRREAFERGPMLKRTMVVGSFTALSVIFGCGSEDAMLATPPDGAAGGGASPDASPGLDGGNSEASTNSDGAGESSSAVDGGEASTGAETS